MLVNYKEIGDTLTDGELNAYASLLANGKVLSEDFQIKNGEITGTYGKYTFDLANASVVDNGILITDETLSNNITLKLSNATQNATYTVHFTVIRYSDTHLLDETSNNIETFDLSVNLSNGETVNIPTTELQKYDIILFNVIVTIHNQPEIIGSWFDQLNINGDKSIIQTNEYVDVTGTLLDNDGEGIVSETVWFYERFIPIIRIASDKSIIQTNEQADVTGTLLTKTGDGISGETLWFYDKYVPTLLKLACSKSIIQTDEQADITATLKDEDNSLVEGAIVWFYEKYIPSLLNIKSDKLIIQTDEQADITATLKDTDGSLVKGATIYFYIKEEA